MLVLEKGIVLANPLEYPTLLYSAPGVGKTTLASQIPGHYFLLTEAGDQGLAVRGSPIMEWISGREIDYKGEKRGPIGFLDHCAEIVTAKENGWKVDGVEIPPIKVIVIDTIENLYEMCARHICDTTEFVGDGGAQKYKFVEDVSYGRGYKRVNRLLLEKLQKLVLHGFGLVLISHVKERQVKWKGQKIDYSGPNLPPSAAEEIVGFCGVVGYMFIEASETKKDEELIRREVARWVCFQPQVEHVAKHRLTGFPERFIIPDEHSGWALYTQKFEETLRARN